MTAAELRLTTKLITRKSAKGDVYKVRIIYHDRNNERQITEKATGYTVTPPKSYKRGKIQYKAEVEELRKKIEAEYQSKLLLEAEAKEQPEAAADKIFFSDWMLKWLDDAKHDIPGTSKNNKPYDETTLYGYTSTVNSIVSYFKEHPYTLAEIDTDILYKFYSDSITEKRTAKTVKRWHSNVSRALEYAKYRHLIKDNPAIGAFTFDTDTGYKGQAFTEAELSCFVSKVKGTWLEIPVWFGARYGMRRSEIIGIKWSMIDFDSGVLNIHGKYVDVDRNGRNPHYESKTKNKSSYRSIPLNDDEIKYLKSLRAIQEDRQKEAGYNMAYTDFVCVKENGDLIKPNYLSEKFPEVCKQAGVSKLTFHGLRRTTVSLLLLNGIQVEEVSKLVGHSSVNTTYNIYYTMPDLRKKRSTATMGKIIATGKPIGQAI